MNAIQIINAGGKDAAFYQAGAPVVIVPQGFTGSLGLTGTYEVYMGGGSTNGLVVDSVVSSGVVHADGFAGYTLQVSGPEPTVDFPNRFLANGTNVALVAGRGFLVWPGAHMERGYIGYPLQSMGYATSWSTNKIFSTWRTNYSTGTPLGSFTSSSLVRSVELYPANMQVTDYAYEIAAFTTGFGFAFTILMFKAVVRMIRSIPTGGDW